MDSKTINEALIFPDEISDLSLDRLDMELAQVNYEIRALEEMVQRLRKLSEDIL